MRRWHIGQGTERPSPSHDSYSIFPQQKKSNNTKESHGTCFRGSLTLRVAADGTFVIAGAGNALPSSYSLQRVTGMPPAFSFLAYPLQRAAHAAGEGLPLRPYGAPPYGGAPRIYDSSRAISPKAKPLVRFAVKRPLRGGEPRLVTGVQGFTPGAGRG